MRTWHVVFRLKYIERNSRSSVLAGLRCWLWGQGLCGQISWWPWWENWQKVGALLIVVFTLHFRLCLTTVLTNAFFFSFYRDTARLVIRKIQFAPTNTGSGQKAELCKSFMMSDKPVLLEAALDKDVCNIKANVFFGLIACIFQLNVFFSLKTDLLPWWSHPY